MSKNNEVIFVCKNCGNEFGKWQGQCPMCKEWNSFKEMSGEVKKNSKVKNSSTRESADIMNLKTMKSEIVQVFSSEIGEFDRVLGKGFVRGGVVLFSGEPGIGKSTLLTQLIGKIGGLYVAGEESASQIQLRVKRLGLDEARFDILETNSIEEIVEKVDRAQNVYKIVVVDSIQVMATTNVTGAVGTVGQIRESTYRLVELAKRSGVVIVVVGHVTKDGEIAGPKLLEHMVDVVVTFEGERNSDLRILRTLKNRFGPTDEVGVFRMEERGLMEMRDENLKMIDSDVDKVGSALTIVMEGNRPMMLEVQALVVESFAPMPKRIFSGIDYNRGQLLVAVVQKSLSVPLYKYDVFISVTGGIRVDDTGADLAVIAAMYSSYKEKPLNSKPTHPSGSPSLEDGGQKNGMVFVGEVSLLGEVKKVKNWERRKKEIESFNKVMFDIKNVRELRKMV
jgi:DNA repair protein RadA/Sms